MKTTKPMKGAMPAAYADGGKVKKGNPFAAKAFKPCAGCKSPAKSAKAGACAAKAKK